MNQTEDKKAYELVLENIKTRQNSFTLTDASGVTGLAIHETKEALSQIMKDYVCQLQVTENGDLIYDFGILKRRGTKSLQEILSTITDFLWKAFTIFFKAWITVTLVVYFILFLVILIAMIIGMASSNKGKSRKSIKLDWVGKIFRAIFAWQTHTGAISYSTDSDGYKYKQYHSNKAVIDLQDKGKKNLIASVYDFVFGPPRVNIDPLMNEKELAAYLRRKKAIVTVSELIALAGWTFDQAEQFMTDCVVRYDGDIKVSDNAVMYGIFERLIRSKSDDINAKIEYYWDEFEPPFLMTGNKSGKNVLIILINGFNLVMGLVVLYSNVIQNFLASYQISEQLITIGLGILPVAFSVLFFLIPIFRMPFIFSREMKRKESNKRKKMLKLLFASVEKYLKLKVVENDIKTSPEHTLSEKEIEDILDKLVIELRGEKNSTDNGELFYRFTRINDEYKEIDLLRKSIKIDSSLGKVIL